MLITKTALSAHNRRADITANDGYNVPNKLGTSAERSELARLATERTGDRTGRLSDADVRNAGHTLATSAETAAKAARKGYAFQHAAVRTIDREAFAGIFAESDERTIAARATAEQNAAVARAESVDRIARYIAAGRPERFDGDGYGPTL